MERSLLKFTAFILILLISHAAIFAQDISKQDHLIYYSVIAKQWRDIVPKLQELWGQCEQNVMNARKTSDHKAGSSSIDNLRRAYNENISDLDRANREITALDETDTALGYKQAVLTFLDDAKTIEQSAMPQLLTVLGVGIDKVTDNQNNALKIFLSKLEELHNRTFQINNLAIRYRQRHGITDDDLRNLGLN